MIENIFKKLLENKYVKSISFKNMKSIEEVYKIVNSNLLKIMLDNFDYKNIKMQSRIIESNLNFIKRKLYE